MMKRLLTVTAIGLTLLTWHDSCTHPPKTQAAFAPKVATPTRPTDLNRLSIENNSSPVEIPFSHMADETK